MGYTSPKISVVSATKSSHTSGGHCLLEITFCRKASSVSSSYCGIICAVNGLGYAVGQKVKVKNIKKKGVCIGFNSSPCGGKS